MTVQKVLFIAAAGLIAIASSAASFAQETSLASGGFAVSWAPCIPKAALVARLRAKPGNHVVTADDHVAVTTSGMFIVYRLQPGLGACEFHATPFGMMNAAH